MDDQNEKETKNGLSDNKRVYLGIFLGAVVGLGIGYLVGDMHGFCTAAPIITQQQIDFIKETSPEAYRLILEAVKK